MNRRQGLVLAGLVVLAGLRGLYWVALTDVWRGDEQQHYGYVESVALGNGIPRLGDLLSDEIAAIGKHSPTNGRLTTPMSTDPASWGIGGVQYEAGQGPPYYALLAVPYRLAAGLDPLARLFGVRVASLALTLTALPLTWLLTRAMVPDRPAAWLLAPGLLAVFQNWNVMGSSFTNDALAAPLGLAAVTAVAWTWRRGPTLPLAVAVGGAFGLALLTKPSTASLAPTLAIGAVAALVRARAGLGRALAWAATAAGVAAALFGPWLLWQRSVYAPQSPEDRFNELLGTTIGRYGWSRDTLARYLSDVTSGLFNFGEFRPGYERYTIILLALTVLAAVGGIVRGRADERFGLAWLATAIPLALVAMVAIVQLALGGWGTIVGRYLLPVIPTAAAVLAAGAVVTLGARAGVVAVLAVAALCLTLEVEHDDTYVTGTYLRGLPQEDSAPAVLQDWTDRFVPAATLAVTPPCPATAIGLAFGEASAPTVLVDGAPVPRFAEERVHGPVVGMAYYALADLSGPFEVAVAAPEVAVAATDRDPALALVGATGDPVARIYCRSPDPQVARFAQTHAPQHPDLSLALVRAWPRAWAVIGWVALPVAAVRLRRAGRSRRG